MDIIVFCNEIILILLSGFMIFFKKIKESWMTEIDIKNLFARTAVESEFHNGLKLINWMNELYDTSGLSQDMHWVLRLDFYWWKFLWKESHFIIKGNIHKLKDSQILLPMKYWTDLAARQIRKRKECRKHVRLSSDTYLGGILDD